ncbi:MAG: NAD(+) synthase, partial [Ruminiclostridium sp.]|nr:NAD(+) synthase [Ruminiclostridium sp.]
MDYGFVRVAAAVPRLKVADCGYNASNIVNMIKSAGEAGVQIVVFPELSITGYTCGDLFHQHALLHEALKQLEKILAAASSIDIVSIIGLPVQVDNQLFNCAAAIQKGKILGIIPKTYIPNYKEFYEERWFASGTGALSSTIKILGHEIPFGADLLFESDSLYKICFGIEICEDLWVPIPPSSYQAVAGAALLFNLSASNDLIGKHEYRKELVAQQSGKCVAGYVYTSSGIDESTTDVVFGGHAIIAENGGILAQSERFQRTEQLVISDIDIQRLSNDRFKNTSFMEALPEITFRKIIFKSADAELKSIHRFIDPHPFVPADINTRDKRCGEIFAIQTAGLAKRLEHTHIQKAVIGISGGLDSTLALLVAVRTFDLLEIPRENIIAATMPGFGTTDITYTNALQLMKSLNVSVKEIDIKAACLQHFNDIGHDSSVYDVTYENVQARERTQILMDMANKLNALVIGTGDLSELALGWCTYNGDHMSMYAVNCSIPKTLVKYLVKWVADNVAEKSASDVLQSVLETPITPELLPPDATGKIMQKTEDIIGPYELHDFFLYHTIRYGAPPEKVLFLAQQAFTGRYA